MDISEIPVPPGIDFPRISPHGFIVSIFVFLAIAIVGTFLRLWLRIFNKRTFGFDDAFLLLSLVTLAATCALNEKLGDILYIQIFASLHVIPFPKHAPGLLRDHQMLQAASFLGWVSIFSAKFSLLLFFRRLVYRIARLETLWTVIMGCVIVFAGITIPLGFMVCTDFSASFVVTCPATLIDQRERTYTIISCIFDVLSDALILIIPAWVVAVVKVDLRQKLALASMLFLSVLSMVIAITRGAGSLLPGGVTDTVWLFFWQAMEAAVAIIMVALTGFRSLFRADGPVNSSGRHLFSISGFSFRSLKSLRHWKNSAYTDETDMEGSKRMALTDVTSLGSRGYSEEQTSESFV